MIGPSRIAPRSAWGALLGLALTLSCARPIDRPLEGAPPLRPGEAPSGRGSDVPPTLSAPAPTPIASPPAAVFASPSPSPQPVARNPILGGLIPAPNAQIPAGPVSIGARISASADLASASLVLNGTQVQPQVSAQDARTWLITYTSRLDVGRQVVRLSAADRDGRLGGYTWEFDVQPRTTGLLPSPLPRP